jgi:hypothetical protein
MKAEIQIEVGDIIQLNPETSPWGPLLCIVDKVSSWGVRCYWLVATTRGEPPGCAYYRAEWGTFVLIGKAEWRVGSPDEQEPG